MSGNPEEDLKELCQTCCFIKDVKRQREVCPFSHKFHNPPWRRFTTWTIFLAILKQCCFSCCFSRCCCRSLFLKIPRYLASTRSCFHVCRVWRISTVLQICLKYQLKCQKWTGLSAWTLLLIFGFSDSNIWFRGPWKSYRATEPITVGTYKSLPTLIRQ